METLLAKPLLKETCVMTEQSPPHAQPCTLPRIASRRKLIPCEDILSSELIAQLELWQHDSLFIRWCRLIRNFQKIHQPFTVFVRKQRFVLHIATRSFCYRAHKNWTPVTDDSPILHWLSNEATLALNQARGINDNYWLSYKNKPHRLHLFIESTGESFICGRP